MVLVYINSNTRTYTNKRINKQIPTPTGWVKLQISMSIWNDCEEHNALPFYGRPIRPSVEGDVVTFDFPLGYEGSGGMQGVAKTLENILGGEIIMLTDNIVKVKFSPKEMGYVVYKYYLQCRH